MDIGQAVCEPLTTLTARKQPGPHKMDLPLQFQDDDEMLSPDEYQHWNLLASALDPRCYVLAFGNNFIVGPFTYPVGVVNSLVVTGIPDGTVATAWDFHRNIDYRQPAILAPGETVRSKNLFGGFTSNYCYYFDPGLQPALVDPRAAYYRRLAIINSIVPETIELTVASGSAPAQPSASLVWTSQPTADYAILCKTSVTDGSWLALQGFLADDVTVWTMNTAWEISDAHSVRIGGSNMVPFARKRTGVLGASAVKMSWGNKLGNYVTGPDVVGDPLLPVFNELGAGGALPAANITNSITQAVKTTQANFGIIQYKPLSPAIMAVY